MSISTLSEEKRRTARFIIENIASINLIDQKESESVIGKVIDASLTGMLLESNTRFEDGSEIRVRLVLLRELVEITAQVRRVQPTEQMFRIGVEFKDPVSSAAYREFLRFFEDTLHPKTCLI